MKKIATILFLVLLFAGATSAQRTGHPGIDLYKEGKNADAVASLSSAVKQTQYKSDPEIWNYLGLASVETGEIKNATEAFEKAIKLAPSRSTYHANLAYVYLLATKTSKGESEAQKAISLDPRNVAAYSIRGVSRLWALRFDDAEKDASQMIAIEPGNPDGYILRSRVTIGRLGSRVTEGSTAQKELPFLEEAVSILKNGAELSKQHSKHKEIVSELESLTAFYDYFSKDRSVPAGSATPEPGTTPIKILNKPHAAYTDRARQANVEGTIRIAALLGSSGRVEQVLVLKRLGSGLDEQAVNAARAVKFVPATRNGLPISKVIILEYGFSIY
ncbi:MAG TPA: TonB family protein [Pyrinomonadaceae bacterium]|nr:TonB family protein [Pyrinomonadaceae bacterium]